MNSTKSDNFNKFVDNKLNKIKIKSNLNFEMKPNLIIKNDKNDL